MEILRTPEERFRHLRNYPFEPNYVEISGLRMHYVDEGPRNGQIVLMLHGEPTWSYLYRFMIPVCAAAGHRVVAPDLIGFGRSDKPAKISDYSYAGHVDWMKQFLETLKLESVTLVCQDWGSLIGLRLVAENADRFARIVVGNGGLPTGDEQMSGAFRIWQNFARYSPWFPAGRIVDSGALSRLGSAERRAYDAPFPSGRYKAGMRALPLLVPTKPDDPAAIANRKAWEILSAWRKPVLTAFSDRDPIFGGGDRILQQRIPGAQGQPHITLAGGHFLQEDSGPQFAQAINRFMATS